MQSQIMYIQEKDDVTALEAVIGLVEKSKTGKTLYYKGREFQSLKGVGCLANYFEPDTGYYYWISGVRKDGNDGLYRTTVHVDQNIRTEYWTKIRGLPELSPQESFISNGKHQGGGKTPKRNRNRDNT